MAKRFECDQCDGTGIVRDPILIRAEVCRECRATQDRYFNDELALSDCALPPRPQMSDGDQGHE